MDDKVRDHDLHAPTVGVLLCTGRDEAVVRYALASSAASMAVATYDTLTPEQRAGLPDPAQLSAALSEVLHAADTAPTSSQAASADPEPADPEPADPESTEAESTEADPRGWAQEGLTASRSSRSPGVAISG